MKTQLMDKTWWKALSTFLLPVIIALAFFVLTFYYYPFREKLQFDTDEGLNLMRSMLVVLGHPLYSQVSSDQPPLFTQLLAILFRFTGFKVNPARFLVILFSTLLVWSSAQFLKITWGNLAAILFLPLIIIAPRYLVLSVSVMIGLPSIALASVSMLFVAIWHQKRKNIWLILSGFMLALSMLIKLFTGFLAPIFLIGITAAIYFDAQDKKFSWKTLRPALIWSISFASLGIVLGLLLVGIQNLPQIIYSHLLAPSQKVFQGGNFSINYHLQGAVPLILLGIFGALISIYRRNWLSLYPLAWAALAYAFLCVYSPIYYHHQLLVTIPLAMMAAAGVADGIHSLIRLRKLPDFIRLQTLVGAAALIGFVLVFNHYLPALNQELSNSPNTTDFSLIATPGKLNVLRTMNEYADQTNWIMTDMPMYAFRVQRPVPPILATISLERLSTGSLTPEDILSAMRKYHPEEALIARFEIPALETYLKKNYTLILSEEFFRLFIRNDLVTSH